MSLLYTIVRKLLLDLDSQCSINCVCLQMLGIYFLKQLKRANIPAKDLLIFYLTCIRPVTEYACSVFHNALPAYLSAGLEQLQKHAMRIIFSFVPYSVALHQSNLETLSDDAGSLLQLSFLIPSLVTQTINCMSSCHLVTVVNPI